MANTTMVSATFPTHNASNITTTKISRPFIGTKQGKASFDWAKKYITPNMSSFRERLNAEGISEKSADLITGARGRGTNTHC